MCANGNTKRSLRIICVNTQWSRIQGMRKKITGSGFLFWGLYGMQWKRSEVSRTLYWNFGTASRPPVKRAYVPEAFSLGFIFMISLFLWLCIFSANVHTWIITVAISNFTVEFLLSYEWKTSLVLCTYKKDSDRRRNDTVLNFADSKFRVVFFFRYFPIVFFVAAKLSIYILALIDFGKVQLFRLWGEAKMFVLFCLSVCTFSYRFLIPRTKLNNLI